LTSKEFYEILKALKMHIKLKRIIKKPYINFLSLLKNWLKAYNV